MEKENSNLERLLLLREKECEALQQQLYAFLIDTDVTGEDGSHLMEEAKRHVEGEKIERGEEYSDLEHDIAEEPLKASYESAYDVDMDSDLEDDGDLFSQFPQIPNVIVEGGREDQDSNIYNEEVNDERLSYEPKEISDEKSEEGDEPREEREESEVRGETIHKIEDKVGTDEREDRTSAEREKENNTKDASSRWAYHEEPNSDLDLSYRTVCHPNYDNGDGKNSDDEDEYTDGKKAAAKRKIEANEAPTKEPLRKRPFLDASRKRKFGEVSDGDDAETHIPKKPILSPQPLTAKPIATPPVTETRTAGTPSSVSSLLSTPFNSHHLPDTPSITSTPRNAKETFFLPSHGS